VSSAKGCAQAAVASASKRRRPQRQRQGRPLGHRGSSPLGAALPSDGARGAANAYVLVAQSQQTAFARSRYTAVARTWVSRSRPNRGSGWADPPCPAVLGLQRLVPKSGLPTARPLRSHRQGASLNTSSLGTLPSLIIIGRHGLTTNCRTRALVTSRKRSFVTRRKRSSTLRGAFRRIRGPRGCPRNNQGPPCQQRSAQRR